MTTKLRYHWFVGSEYLGESPYPLFIAPVRKQHWAFACPICGEVWARICLDGDPNATWLFNSRCCPQHGYGFLLPFLEEFTVVAPEAVLRREITLIGRMPDPNRYEITLLTNGDNPLCRM